MKNVFVGILMAAAVTAIAETSKYRVYANGRQIASTVATSCRLAAPAQSISVVAVDRWGNVGKGQQ